MLVLEFNQPETNAWGLGMKGAFNTVEDALVWGVNRAIQSRASLRDKMFLVTFDENEAVQIPVLGHLAHSANKRIGKEFFAVVEYTHDEEIKLGLTYNTPVLVSGRKLPSKQRYKVVNFLTAA